MCGIVGFLTKCTSTPINIEKMCHLLDHRGPDSSGVWSNPHIGLGHTRLSIHDLTSAGHQPMHSHSSRWVLVFNGEIYNYKAIAKELQKSFSCNLQSTSDTEVLVNAIDLWGIEKTLRKTIGMFAFACWDKKEKKLYLARDRFGEKPLYYGQLGTDFAFSSELKPLQLAYSEHLKINRDALTSYMRYGYVPTPYSIYKNVFKLEQSHYAIIDESLNVKTYKYYDPTIALNHRNTFSGSFDDAVNKLEELLRETLSLQMASDVPLGAFLSGGIDSSTIVALMQSMSSSKINTFSIGFNEAGYNEAEHARAIAKHLGTNHTDMYVSQTDVMDVIPQLPNIYDEPFADSSQIPTHLVSKIAKSKVTVSLSGDAGDELFGGYNRYFLADTVKRRILHNFIIRSALTRCPTSMLKLIGKSSNKYRLLTDKLMKLQNVIKHSSGSATELYKQLCSQIYQPNALVINGQEPDMLYQKGLLALNDLPFTEWMMFADTKTYMADDILTKVDRAAMAVSLETRVPFLDHRIFEFAWQLPQAYKIKGGQGKHVLKALLYKYVPQLLIDRPKMGFAVPIDNWLRTDLKDWAEELLNPSRIAREGYLNPKLVSQYWREHQSGKRNWQHALWNILMFQSWLETNYNLQSTSIGTNQQVFCT